MQKIPSRFIFVATLLLVPLMNTSGQAATEVTVNLAGAVIQNGQTISLASAGTLDAAAHYHYAITGTCHGTGNLAGFIPTGTSIQAAMATLGASAFASNLSGDIADPEQTFPLTVVDQPIEGSFSFGPLTGSANADVLAEINESGAVAFGVSNVSVLLNESPDSSSIVFEEGAKCVVEVKATLARRPDISLEPAIGDSVGDDVYNDKTAQTAKATVAKGTTTDFSFYVANDGTSDDDIFVKAVPTAPGFKIQYMLGGTVNVTSALSTTGIILGLNSGQGAHIYATVTVKKTAAKGMVQNLRMKISSALNSSLADQAGYMLKVSKQPAPLATHSLD